MSKLLEMSEDFNRSSRQQAADIEQIVKADLDEHANSIKSALKESELKIRSDIAGHRKVPWWVILGNWMRVVLLCSLMLGGMYAIVWGQGRIIAGNQKTIDEQNREIKKQERTINRLEGQTWGINLYLGENGRFIVLPADQTIDPDWTVGKLPAILLVEED